MHLLFEEEGDLKVGAVLSSTDTSFQVELPGGKRTKIKSGHVLLRFERPAGAMLLEQARREAGALDVDFLWQCAPQQEFGFQELAREYFGREPAAVEAAAILMRLHSAPVYFHRKGKGRFRPAPPDVLQAALAAVAKRREQDERRASHVAELLAGRLPEPIRCRASRRRTIRRLRWPRSRRFRSTTVRPRRSTMRFRSHGRLTGGSASAFTSRLRLRRLRATIRSTRWPARGCRPFTRPASR